MLAPEAAEELHVLLVVAAAEVSAPLMPDEHVRRHSTVRTPAGVLVLVVVLLQE
jgi:hypothetical protein